MQAISHTEPSPMRQDMLDRYAEARKTAPADKPIAVLHIGQACTAVATGKCNEVSVYVLEIGYERISHRFFKQYPPREDALEHAIFIVEEEVVQLEKLLDGETLLYSSDALVREIAQVAGISGEPAIMTLDTTERTFDLLVAVVMGRPVSSSGLPPDSDFAATLLILREFMHHMRFPAIRVL